MQSSKKKGVNAVVDSILNHTNLSPDIVAAILADALPNGATLFDIGEGPLTLWAEQSRH